MKNVGRNAAAQRAEPANEVAVDRVTAMHNLLKLTNSLMAPFSTHFEKSHRISVNEFRVLMMIGQMKETASHELAVVLGVNTMAVSRAVAALQRHGRITAETDAQSRRRKTLRLTEEGMRLYREMMPSSMKVADYLFSALRPHEVLAFDHYVQMLTERIDAQDEQGSSRFLAETRPMPRDADGETGESGT